jgi:hypothetical protein
MKPKSQLIWCWRINLKRKYQLQKKDPKLKKMTIKIIEVKIEIQDKFYFWLKCDIEKKNYLNKMIKNQLKE